MAFVNSPDRYVALGSHDERVLANGFPSVIAEDDKGLFYPVRGQDDPQQVERQRAEAILENPAHSTLQDYQYWAESGWKTPHGTYAAADRFGKKVYEEHEELHLAIKALKNAKYDDKPVKPHVSKVLHELGDVLWCMSAEASNASVGLDESMKNTLYRYVMGMQHWAGSEPVEPSWRPAAARLATKYGLITVGDIDELIAARFEPTPSPVMNVDADEFENGVEEHMNSLLFNVSAARNASEMQYGYGEGATASEKFLIMPEYYHKMGSVVGELVATSILEIAFIAKWALGKRLGAVIAANVTKVSGRIQKNLVDKADGKRPNELK